jgi:hypothetical protein
MRQVLVILTILLIGGSALASASISAHAGNMSCGGARCSN